VNTSAQTPELSDSAAALREGVERALSEFLTVDYWHRLESAGEESAWDAELWQLITELAIPELLVEESLGGAEASLLEATGALEALGALAVPAPAAEVMIASWCASKAELALPATTVTLGPCMPQDHVTLTTNNRGIRLTADMRGIPFARHCSAIVLQGTLNGATVTCALPTDTKGVSLEPQSSLNGEARDRVIVDTTLSTAQVSDAIAIDVLRASAAMRSIQMSSALNASLNMCVDYVTERKQFGRPLAKFQAIQQQLAVMAALTTSAQVSARQAFVTLTDPTSPTAVAAAKIATGQAASQGTAIAHQVHGAMGFTAEYGLHRLSRRLWTWREEFGNETWWSRQLGDMSLNAGAGGLWDLLIDEPAA
jgi:acyl-CoA dehydrogenase